MFWPDRRKRDRNGNSSCSGIERHTNVNKNIHISTQQIRQGTV
jgi:hypothetical protein